MNIRNIRNLFPFLIVVFFFTSCNNKQKMDKLRVVYWKDHIINDTVYIQNKDLISKLNNTITEAKLQPCKFIVNIWLEQVIEDSIVRIGIKGTRYKKREGQFQSKENLEELIAKELSRYTRTSR